ncbi:hypothetical protein [Mycolicibacterium sphagni]|uniref:Uncharacterized protein n=1 Tax=Mycolicibacterium sphagni TaxID=1786 RepID=A0A255E0Q1_9MYCO|nr:hypothetical protein [Mycolicibacterium sphagni]MCV7179452.1 hypothetical protein [Mycolicibacterium sphagni]OYN82952.1 hypothetical protein CG716_01785 [Mycolicibacterium sphagni]
MLADTVVAVAAGVARNPGWLAAPPLVEEGDAVLSDGLLDAGDAGLLAWADDDESPRPVVSA